MTGQQLWFRPVNHAIQPIQRATCESQRGRFETYAGILSACAMAPVRMQCGVICK